MDTLRAYYDGSAFVPVEFCALPKGEVVTLSIVRDAPVEQSPGEKLAMFRRLTGEFRELNETEPLPPEFDDIMASRVNFARELDL